jgi:hypothetical protein
MAKPETLSSFQLATVPALKVLLPLADQPQPPSRHRTEQCISRWRSWPRDPSAFSIRLRDAAATLRKIGITAGFGRDTSTNRSRIVELRRLDSEPRPDTLDSLDTLDTLDTNRGRNVVIFPKK